MAKAIGYIVRTGTYGDSVTDYKAVDTRANVEAELTNSSYMDNPAIWVYKLTKGEVAADVIADLASSPDPYPDWNVEFGPRGGVQWQVA